MLEEARTTRRTLIQLAAVLIAPVVACSGDRPAGPDPLASCGDRATQITLAVGQYVSVDPASDSGCVTFPANAAADSAEYLVVPQSVAGASGRTATFQLRGGAVGATAPLVASVQAPPAWGASVATTFDAFRRSLARRRSYTMPAARRPSLAATGVTGAVATGPPALGALGSFTVCDTLNCSSFKNVGARVKAVGAHVAIYVDTLAPTPGLDSADLDTLKQVFDSRLYPLDTTAFGGVSDIDANTVVIVLMTGVVNKLVPRSSQCASASFVAGFFFPGDLDPAFASRFNQCGDSPPHRLVNSALSGSANVAAQTGQPFATSLTNWALANWVSDLPGFTAPPQLRYTSWHFRTTYQSLHSQDPGDFLLPFPLVPKASSGDAITLSGVLQSGSGLYQRALQRGGAAGFGLLFAGAGGAPLPLAVAARLNIIRIR